MIFFSPMETEIKKAPEPMLAIRMAMLATYCALINHNDDQNYGSMSEILERKTNQRCAEAAKMMATFVNVHYRNLFESSFILVATGGDFKNDEWGQHHVFIAKDFDGNFYAASPANHEGPWEDTKIFDVIKTKTVGEAISKLQEENAGIWPDIDFVEMVLNTIDFEAYKTRDLGVSLIRNRAGSHFMEANHFYSTRSKKIFFEYESPFGSDNSESFSFNKFDGRWLMSYSYSQYGNHEAELPIKPNHQLVT
jgi:hypothetical protein